MTALRAGGATDVGRVRSSNQDQLLVAEDVFAVADGMGGHAAGEIASQTAVEAFEDAFDADRSPDGLLEAVRVANRAVWDRAREQPELRGMGTTLTAVALVPDGNDEILKVVNVGDSRAYLLRDGELRQLTDDHSVPGELRRAGRLTDAEAAAHPQRNVLTRALGIDADVQVDSFDVKPYRGDRIVLASDGLSNEVDDDAIASVLRTVPDPDEAASRLVAMARQGGGSDNITVVIVDVVDDDHQALRASAALASDATVGDHPPAADQPTSVAPAPPAAAPPSPPANWTPRPPRVPSAPAGDVVVAPPARRSALRTIGFVVAVLVIFGVAAVAIGWYARGGYFVGVQGEEVAIFKGRPGGLLWFDPTVAERSGVRIDQVLPHRADDVRAGKHEPSLAAARRYVANIAEEAAPSAATTTTTTTTTVPATAPPAP